MLRIQVPTYVIAAGLLFVIGCAPASTSTTSSNATSALPGPRVTPPAVSASPSALASPSATGGVAAAAAVTVQMNDNLRFDPPSVTVPRGASVTWLNTSQVIHTATDDPSKAANSADALLPAGAQPWDSGEVAPAHTFTQTFDVPGTYKYFCQPHEAAGMVGTIVVT